MSDSVHDELDSPERAIFNSIADTIRTNIIVLLTFSFFCWIIVGAPDTSLLRKDAFINIPFAGTTVSFPAFLIIAPLILTGLFAYTHILFYDLYKIAGSINYTFVLLNVRSKLSRAVALLVLYWTTPITLAAITYKAMTRLEWAIPMMVVTIGVVLAAGAVWRAMNASYSSGYVIRKTTTLAGLLDLTLIITAYFRPDYLLRDLHLQRANLQNAWLTGSDLTRVDFSEADLTNANLRRAVLSSAILRAADLRKSILRDADLRNAVLVEASLGAADAVGADFTDANLQGAHLRGTDLRRATLAGADLTDADLTRANVGPSELRGAILCRTILKDGRRSEDACP